MSDTIFTRIIKRELPAEILYEDELTLAFLDIRPVNPGHALVITKAPFINLYELDDENRNAVFQTVQKIATVLKRALNADGINVRINTEAAAGQDVFHFHAHVIPRFEGDGHEPWPGGTYAEGEKESVANKIRASLM
jgi:histidine triad (HIT) family protein